MNRRALLRSVSLSVPFVAGCTTGMTSLDETPESPTPTVTVTQTDTPTETATSQSDCAGSSSNYSWQMSGTWQVDLAVRNRDGVSHTVRVEIVHHGSEPCHHSKSTPTCQSPEKVITPFEQEFELPANETQTVEDIALDLWEEWIDDYTVQVQIEDVEPSRQDSAFAYEKGAKESIGADEYEQADFYVCDDALRFVNATISDGAPQTTP